MGGALFLEREGGRGEGGGGGSGGSGCFHDVGSCEGFARVFANLHPASGSKVCGLHMAGTHTHTLCLSLSLFLSVSMSI